MTGDLVETLLCVDRGGVLHSRRPKQTHPVCAKAADRIEALEAEIERLRVQLAQTIMQQDEEWQNKKAENERLREELAAAYVDQSGTVQHASDCATSNAPAMKPGPCDCAALGGLTLFK